MAFADAEQAIEDRITSVWGAQFPAVTFFFNNAGKVEPATAPHAIFLITGQAEEIRAFGGGRGKNEYDTIGIVHGIFLIPLFGAKTLGRNMRDKFCDTFRSQRFSGLSFYGVTPIASGAAADKGNFFRYEAVAEFEYRFKG